MADSWKLILAARGTPRSLLMSMYIWCFCFSGVARWVSRGLEGECRLWGKETAIGGAISLKLKKG